MSAANQDVLAFYRELPFNYGSTAEADAREVLGYDPLVAYPILQPLLAPTARILEVGCGVGWLSTSVALRHGCSVTAIDANPVVIARARAVAGIVGAVVDFIEADLFAFEPAEPFDLVMSIGVLHCTDDCRAAVLRCAVEFTRPGGHLLLGLYHRYGRRPFLDHFASLRARGADEDDLLSEYARLHRGINDPVKLRSWFRDQVLVPFETQHTLAEVADWAGDAGCSIVSTSINRFAPIIDLNDVIGSEYRYEAIAKQRLLEGTFFPGFFVALLHRA